MEKEQLENIVDTLKDNQIEEVISVLKDRDIWFTSKMIQHIQNLLVIIH